GNPVAWDGRARRSPPHATRLPSLPGPRYDRPSERPGTVGGRPRVLREARPPSAGAALPHLSLDRGEEAARRPAARQPGRPAQGWRQRPDRRARQAGGESAAEGRRLSGGKPPDAAQEPAAAARRRRPHRVGPPWRPLP